MTLPTLYKRTSHGAIECWSIGVEPDVAGGVNNPYNIVTKYGQLGGKVLESCETVYEGKNLGKKNATTAQEQAEAQAQSEWEAKRTRKGYTEDLAKAEAGGNDGAGGIRPMLAKKYSEHGDKLTYPLYGQPKLDGIRCIAVITPERRGSLAGVTVQLWSREQKPIVAVPHIQGALMAQLAGITEPVVLDGELYNHDFRHDFEKIASIVRQQAPVYGEEAQRVQYHVYDAPSQAGHYGTRLVKLALLLPNAPGSFVRLVETRLVADEDALLAYLNDCQERGYEGCMARALEAVNKKGKQVSAGEYEPNTRSYCLQKLKSFDEGEFDIIGAKEGVGKMAGLAVFECRADNGNPFDVKMEGELEGLRKYLVDPATWQGKRLTVKYFRLTNKNKVPRFPVGKAVRDYE